MRVLAQVQHYDVAVVGAGPAGVCGSGHELMSLKLLKTACRLAVGITSLNSTVAEQLCCPLCSMHHCLHH
jgi:ribulose 1,5-bisphosphate synthetase/thiazole synthase